MIEHLPTAGLFLTLCFCTSAIGLKKKSKKKQILYFQIIHMYLYSAAICSATHACNTILDSTEKNCRGMLRYKWIWTCLFPLNGAIVIILAVIKCCIMRNIMSVGLTLKWAKITLILHLTLIVKYLQAYFRTWLHIDCTLHILTVPEIIS